MKKGFVFVLALIVWTNSSLFSGEQQLWEDGWLAMGANFGNYFQNDAEFGNYYAGSLGINFSGYGFLNSEKNTGIFFNHSLLLPYQNPLAVNTIDNNFDQVVSIDLLMGPGFRYNINEKLKLHYGAGVNFNVFNFFCKENDNIKFSNQRIGLGIGADVGLKYDITDIVYLNFGAALNLNFANYRVAESTADNWTNTRRDSSGWDFTPMFGIRPYIAIGVNYYNKKTPLQWGNPKTSD